METISSAVEPSEPELPPPPRLPILGLLLSALAPLAIAAVALVVPSLFPPADAILPGPDYGALGDRVGADARAGRIPVDPDGSLFSEEARKRRALVFSRDRDDDAFRRLGEPVAGEWLAHFREPGQTYVDYVGSRPNRKTAQRDRLHLLPYGDLAPLQRAVLDDTRHFLEAFFAVEVQALPVAHPPRDAWSPSRRQWDAEAIADAQMRAVPRDSLGVLGLLGGDLHVAGLNFVFGIGGFDDRVGVHSLHRYGTEREELTERAFKLAAHELGHMFGIAHCVFYDCVMNGVNSLDELDASSPHLCPVCHDKLRHALGFDPAERYDRLAAVYGEHGMAEEALFATSRANACR